MKNKYNLLKIIIIVLAFLDTSYGNDFNNKSLSIKDDYVKTNSSYDYAATYQATFFAQTHIKQPSENYFFLTSDRSTFVKTYVVSSTGTVPNVTLEVTSPMFQGTTNSISMTAPGNIPTSNVNLAYGEVDHTLDNAFTATIPGEWIKIDTQVVVKVDGTVVQTFTSSDLNVKSSNPLRFNMYDIHAFSLGGINADMTAWEDDFRNKLPVSSLDFNYVPDILFPEIAVPPNNGNPAVIISSIQEYTDKTGSGFNIHNVTAKQWKNALHMAQGAWSKYTAYTSVGYYYDGGQQLKGEGSDYTDVHAKGAKLVWHEIGHATGLPHWQTPPYPYKGDMYGISKPDLSEYHVGPVWAYDFDKNQPIPPTVQENAVGTSNSVGNYKQDPMRGGSSGDQEVGFAFRHFSDYSTRQQAINFQDGSASALVVSGYVVWNPDLTDASNPDGMYAKWSPATGKYTDVSSIGTGIDNNNSGIEYPLNGDLNRNVYSLMFAISSNSDVKLAYPPIGPYKAGMINLFDPTEGTSAEAQEFCNFIQGWHDFTGCEYTARVTQGGQVKHFMVRAQSTDDGFDTTALNISSADGTVTKVELLDTPGVEDDNSFPTNPTVLASWTDSSLSTASPYRNDNELKLYPNPSQGVFYIKSKNLIDQDVTVSLMDLTGKRILNKTVKNVGAEGIKLQTEKTGVFLLRIETASNSIVKKLIVN